MLTGSLSQKREAKPQANKLKHYNSEANSQRDEMEHFKRIKFKVVIGSQIFQELSD